MTLPFKASQLATQRPCGLVDGRFLVARANEGNAASPTTPSSSLKGSWERGGRVTQGNRNDLKDQQKMNKGVRMEHSSLSRRALQHQCPRPKEGKESSNWNGCLLQGT